MRRKASRAGVWLIVAAVLTGMAWLSVKVLRRLDNQGLRPVTIAEGLEHPWSMALLPDGSMLVTERPGRLRRIRPDGVIGEPIGGLLPVAPGGEGGLMDVVLDPEFASTRLLYWSFSEPAATSSAMRSTAVARGRLEGDLIVDARVIFRQAEKSSDGSHFGSRLVFAADGSLFVGLGDRGRRDAAQQHDSALGKVIRIDSEGRTISGGPMESASAALGSIWSLGHRNIQGLAIQPASGRLWATEHGPQGGDELNLIQPGLNYGWPVISHGTEYSTGARIGEGSIKAGLEQPVIWWGPVSVAPSGLTFLNNDARYPDWKGHLFMGTLRGESLVRMRLDGTKVIEQQRLLTGLNQRIRDVRQGPDGWLYVLTDSPNGRVIRVER